MAEVVYENGAWKVPSKGQAVGIYELAILKAAVRGILIPSWVPRRLIAEYADCAELHGEQTAASHIRKIKAELQL